MCVRRCRCDGIAPPLSDLQCVPDCFFVHSDALTWEDCGELLRSELLPPDGVKLDRRFISLMLHLVIYCWACMHVCASPSSELDLCRPWWASGVPTRMHLLCILLPSLFVFRPGARRSYRNALVQNHQRLHTVVIFVLYERGFCGKVSLSSYDRHYAVPFVRPH